MEIDFKKILVQISDMPKSVSIKKKTNSKQKNEFQAKRKQVKPKKKMCFKQKETKFQTKRKRGMVPWTR